jgi:nucleoside-diphosphate-sugar epimerase
MIIGITGGTNGLGKRLVEYLIAKGHQVKVLVRKTSQIDHLIQWGAELVYGDINEPDSLVPLIRDIDICYHIAAQVSGATKEQLFKINVKGTQNICETILKTNPDCRLVYCSSMIVNDIRFYNKFLKSSYAISKYKAENIVSGYIKKQHLKASIISPGYIYGPYDRNFMPSVLKALQYGLKFLIKGGEKNAAVVYVDDLCELFHLAGTKDVALGKKYVGIKKSDIGIHGFLKMVAEKMNYSFPQKVYPKLPLVLIAVILEKIHRIFRIRSTPRINTRLIDALSYQSKYFNENAIRELGWDQRVNIPEGIDKALTWQMNRQ